MKKPACIALTLLSASMTSPAAAAGGESASPAAISTRLEDGTLVWRLRSASPAE